MDCAWHSKKGTAVSEVGTEPSSGCENASGVLRRPPVTTSRRRSGISFPPERCRPPLLQSSGLINSPPSLSAKAGSSSSDVRTSPVAGCSIRSLHGFEDGLVAEVAVKLDLHGAVVEEFGGAVAGSMHLPWHRTPGGDENRTLGTPAERQIRRSFYHWERCDRSQSLPVQPGSRRETAPGPDALLHSMRRCMLHSAGAI